MRRFLAVILLLLFGSRLFATTAPFPVGLIELTSGNAIPFANIATDPGLSNPIVDGIRVRVDINTIIPTSASTYDWSIIDEWVAQCSAHHKFMGISISAGVTIPDYWYTSLGVYRYVLSADDPQFPGQSMPLPWDTVYQGLLRTFINAFAAHVATLPNKSVLRYVAVTGFSKKIPFSIADAAADVTALTALSATHPTGYAGLTTNYATFTAAMVPAAETVTGYWQAAFPNTALILTLEALYTGSQGTADQLTIRDAMKAAYPGQVGTLFNGRKGSCGPHAFTEVPVNYPKIDQANGPITTSLYTNAPCDPVITTKAQAIGDLCRAAQEAQSAGIEIYSGDLADSTLQAELTIQRARFHFFTLEPKNRGRIYLRKK